MKSNREMTSIDSLFRSFITISFLTILGGTENTAYFLLRMHNITTVTTTTQLQLNSNKYPMSYVPFVPSFQSSRSQDLSASVH